MGIINMTAPAIYWKQRFGNFEKALAQLHDADCLAHQRTLSRLEKLGLIHTFEFTYALAWKVLKDFLSFQGVPDLAAPLETTNTAFEHHLIKDAEGWMMMLADKNRTSNAYQQGTADGIAEHIHRRYVGLFRHLSGQLAIRLADD